MKPLMESLKNQKPIIIDICNDDDYGLKLKSVLIENYNRISNDKYELITYEIFDDLIENSLVIKFRAGLPTYLVECIVIQFNKLESSDGTIKNK